jgi:hypothetical protein
MRQHTYILHHNIIRRYPIRRHEQQRLFVYLIYVPHFPPGHEREDATEVSFGDDWRGSHGLRGCGGCGLRGSEGCEGHGLVGGS